MSTLDVADGDDITSAVANATGDVIVPGAATRADAPTYRASKLDFSGSNKRLLADGWVHVDFSQAAGDARHPHRGVVGSGEMGGYADGLFGGGHWVLDQTADNLHLSTRLGSGAQFGNSHGRIFFKGVGDIRGSVNWSDSSGHDMTLSMANDGSHIHLQNVSWLDGTYVWADGERVGNCGFTWSNRSGDVTVEGCYFKHFPNNVFYFKPHGGRLVVRDSYFDYCTAGNLRVGSAGGCLVENTTFRMGQIGARQGFGYMTGGWAGIAQIALRAQANSGGTRYVTFRECDFVQAGSDLSGIVLQEHNTSAQHVITIENSRRDSGTSVQNGSNLTLDGSFGSPAAGADASAFREAGAFDEADDGSGGSGNSGDGGSGDDGSGSDDGTDSGGDGSDGSDSEDGTESTLTIETPADGSGLTYYEITVDGPVERGPAAESHDTITANDDGTHTVTGKAMPGYVDDFRYQGSLVDVRVEGPTPTIRVDGEPLAASDWPHQDARSTVTVQGTGGATTYVFTASAIEKGRTAEDLDIRVQYANFDSLSGQVAKTFADTYHIEGDLMGFQYAGSTPRVFVDGVEVDPDDLGGA